MRILLVTGEYPPLKGGVGAYTRELGRALVRRGHQVIILTSLVSDPVPHRPSSHEPQVEYTVQSWHAWDIVRLVRRIRNLGPDIVDLQYEPAAFDLRGAITFLPRLMPQKPTVVTFHDLLPPYWFPKAGQLRQWSVLQLAQQAAGCIVTNHKDLEKLQARLPKIGPHLRLIPIGSNIAPQVPESFDPVSWRSRQGYEPTDLVIGFFGFLNRSKGVSTLLHSLAQLIERGLPAKLLFIGGRTGSSDPTNRAYAAEINGLIQRLGLTPHVAFTGFIPQEEVSAALASIDVCALPFTSGANLRHGTLHAALAHGCAIVTTEGSPPAPELEPGHNVLLVPPRAPEALADAIVTLVTDADMRERLRKGARTLAERFTWARIAQEKAHFYRDVLENFPKRGLDDKKHC